ncbi:MAG: sigma-70 family RNA polymerase sigma factor [Candidatus Eiseniibacteriota bacterium]|nr:MAG: sigma-70 family RNA polymerase sigma factor [Candidatus Eisenbacteria bacterium]
MKKRLFEEFLKEHADRVFSYALYLLRNREDAEDVTQEVFAKLWQHWPRTTSTARVAFTMRAARNQCIDLLRRRKTSGDHMRAPEWLDLDSVPAARSPELDPELHAELTETQEVVLSALEALPERTRSMLLMHYFQGLKHETIGEILDVTTSTVKVTMHRGRALLRRALTRRSPETARMYSDD